MMNSHKQLFTHLRLFLPFLLFSGQIMGIQADTTNKLFVFGDSFVDGGNTPRDGSIGRVISGYSGNSLAPAIPLSDAWKVPYGKTVPGEPAGRFSDGRVLSDYIAIHLGLPSPPVPYESRNDVPSDELKYGMNFAYGGTGLNDTVVPLPNMTTQIDFFERLIDENVYNVIDLSKSMAMLSSFGNDYLYFRSNGGNIWNYKPFTRKLVEQMTTNLIRVQRLGVKKIAVTSVPPFGCIPIIFAQTPFRRCVFDYIFNPISEYHNTLLKEAVTTLNQVSTDGTTFLFLDLYESFISVISNPSANNITEVESGCCNGVSDEYACGNVDQNNEPKYTVCDDPESTLFWDAIHPSNAGWQAVYNNLETGDLGHLRQF